MKNPIRFVWLFFGFISLGLGTAGIVLPFLPTVPFYLATEEFALPLYGYAMSFTFYSALKQ